MSDHASCCVLSYERPEFLATAVTTLLDAGAPLELIVHDDGSMDPRVYDLLYDWQESGAVSSVILNPPGYNQGQGTALNRMFGLASGDPIIKLDQDLVFTPGWLAKVTELMAHYPRIGLLGLFHYHHDPCDSAKTEIPDFSPIDGTWTARTHVLGSAFAVSRACWDVLGPFEEHSAAFAEDWAFQRAVTNSEHWVCALPDEDLVCNQGFGIGPSTVVTAPGVVHPIHTGPKLVGA